MCVCVRVCEATILIIDSSRSPLVSSHFIQPCLYCCPLRTRVWICVCRCRWGRDGFVLTRQQQQQPVETKAGWFIAPYREHKSHLQRRAFKRPASWQHLPFINDWAEPPTEPETTKLTHSHLTLPLFQLPPSRHLISIFFFSPSISHIILSPSPSSPCFYLPLPLFKYYPPICLHHGLRFSICRAWCYTPIASLCSHSVSPSTSIGDIQLKLLKRQQHCHHIRSR